MPNQTRDHANKEEHATFLKAAKSSLFLESEKKNILTITSHALILKRLGGQQNKSSDLPLIFKKKNDLLSNYNKPLYCKE